MLYYFDVTALVSLFALGGVLYVNTLQGKNQSLHLLHSTLQYWTSVVTSIPVPKISHKLPDVLGKKMGFWS